ncbi:cilia- and flagella-associated protein 107-like [Oscarella lobularis]|uniref:cilia- and flagella-associated protein 107-like n=1 Tax=Oscarella lobularis TaxID=121494 RepID=UPI003314327B
MDEWASARADQQKWHQPGWRIEQRYTKGVLIGNWFEDQQNFQKGNHASNSTHREDYRSYKGEHFPDATFRRNALARSDGIGRKHLFVHHGTRYSNNMLPLYRDTFTRSLDPRYAPTVRQWDRNKMSWQPEPIDQLPASEGGQRYGLYTKLQEKWKKQAEIEAKGDYMSSYGLSYLPHAPDALVTHHHAAPRHLSTRLHPHRANKDLQLRSSLAIPCIERPVNSSLFCRSAPS